MSYQAYEPQLSFCIAHRFYDNDFKLETGIVKKERNGQLLILLSMDNRWIPLTHAEATFIYELIGFVKNHEFYFRETRNSENSEYSGAAHVHDGLSVGDYSELVAKLEEYSELLGKNERDAFLSDIVIDLFDDSRSHRLFEILTSFLDWSDSIQHELDGEIDAQELNQAIETIRKDIENNLVNLIEGL